MKYAIPGLTGRPMRAGSTSSKWGAGTSKMRAARYGSNSSGPRILAPLNFRGGNVAFLT